MQTYSNGEVVRWIDTVTEGGAEAEHPAPTLTLTAATEEAATTPSPSAPVATDVATADDVDSAKTVGYVAIGVGAVAIVIGLAALMRKRTA